MSMQICFVGSENWKNLFSSKSLFSFTGFIQKMSDDEN
jgi:hypothetical protein